MIKKVTKYSFVIMILLFFLPSLAACGPINGEESPPTAGSDRPSAEPTQIAQATATTTVSSTATLTRELTVEAVIPLEMGTITITPSNTQEGGWVAIGDSQTVLIQWIEAPTAQIKRADFYLAPTGTGTFDARQSIGSDSAAEDGASITWQVLPGGFTAHFWAEGYDETDSQVAHSALLSVYADGAASSGTDAIVEPGPPAGGEVITPLNIDRLAAQYSLPLPADITGMAWSPDNETLAVATTNGVALFDTLAETQSGVIALGFPTSKLQFSLDGSYLLLLPFDSSAGPVLWDMATGTEAEAFAGEFAGMTGATFSPDGRWLVTGTEEGALITWDLASGNVAETIDLFAQGISPGGKQPRINDLAYLPDGQTLIIEVGGEWIEWLLWDLVEGRSLGLVSPEGHIAGPVASPLFAPADWQHIYWLSRGSIIKVDIQTDEELGAFHHQDFVMASAFSPSGLLLATVSSQIVGDVAVPTLTLWDVSQGQPARIWADLVNMPVALAFSRDGKHLAYATNGEGVTVLGISQAP